MNFKQIGEKYLVKLDKGEVVVEILTKFCQEQQIKNGLISGIGGVSSATLGWYEVETKSYHWIDFSGHLEVTSLNGNVALLKGQPFLHLHATITNEQLQGFGGHLKEARVGVTLEVVIERLDGELSRKMDDEIGLNLLEV